MRNEFGANHRLRCLLSLKRHELPPTDFFDALPRQIRARIERERRPRISASLASWWRHLRLEWDLKPAFAGAALIAVSGIYFFGIETESQFPETYMPLPSSHYLSGSAFIPRPLPASVSFVEVEEQATSLSARGHVQPSAGLFRPDSAKYSGLPSVHYVVPGSGSSNAPAYRPASLETQW